VTRNGPFDGSAAPDRVRAEGCEVVRRDTQQREHEVTTGTDRSAIARDRTISMAARTYPGRPSSRLTDF
jgi:hypothetical protein